jgi:hypothetical protein
MVVFKYRVAGYLVDGLMNIAFVLCRAEVYTLCFRPEPVSINRNRAFHGTHLGLSEAYALYFTFNTLIYHQFIIMKIVEIG